MKKIYSFGYIVASFSILLLLWIIAIEVGGYSEHFLPSPASVWRAFVELFNDGRLIPNILVSLKRFFIGYLAASALAIVLGVFFGWFKRAWRLAEPVILFLKPISPIAWASFIMLWFGVGDAPAIVTIALATFFNLLVSTVKAVQNVSKSYFKVAQNFGLSNSQILRKIVFPASFPLLANGLHAALGASWIFLVAGELIGTSSGLGFLINDSRQTLRTDYLMVGIILIGMLGYIMDKALTWFETIIAQKWGIK